MNKFGPSRSELRMRLAFSAAGLSLMLAAVAYRGIPEGPAMIETIGIAGVFFGGTFLWALRKLLRKDYPDAG